MYTVLWDTIHIPVGLQARRSGGVPWITVTQVVTPEDCLSPFLKIETSYSKGQGMFKDGVFLLFFFSPGVSP